MVYRLFFVLAVFFFHYSAFAQESNRAYSNKSPLKSMMPNKNSFRKIFSSTAVISSCTRDCQSQSICTNQTLIAKCPHACAEKTGVLRGEKRKTIEKWDFERIWRQRCPGKPIPENWKTHPPASAALPGGWKKGGVSSSATSPTFTLMTVEKAKHLVGDIKLKSTDPSGDIKYTDGQLKQIVNILSSLSPRDLNDSAFKKWINSQGGGIKNSYEEAHHNSIVKELKKQFSEFMKKNPTLKPGVNVFYTNSPFYTGILKRKPSSGRHNNCLLFSFIGDNLDLLTKVLGNALKAAEILKKPEIGPNSSASRDFSSVRYAVMTKIKEALDKPFQHSLGFEITLRDYLGLVAEKENMGSVDALLNKFSRSDDFLDSQFAPVFSYLYKVPAYVLNPNPDNPMELKYNDADPLSHQPGKPILIYHDGQRGVHYEKLVPVGS